MRVIVSLSSDISDVWFQITRVTSLIPYIYWPHVQYLLHVVSSALNLLLYGGRCRILFPQHLPIHLHNIFFTIGLFKSKTNALWNEITSCDYMYISPHQRQKNLSMGINKGIPCWQTENNSPRLTSWGMGVSLQSCRNNSISWWI